MKLSTLVMLAMVLVLQLTAASLPAQSIQDLLEDQNVFVGAGRAVIRTFDSGLTVVGFDDGDGVVDRVFTIATPRHAQAGRSVPVLFARLAAWSGGLLVLDPLEKTAFLFAASPAKNSPAARTPPAAQEDLETSLRNRYTVTRFNDVAWIAARWGRLDGLRLDEVQRAEEPALRSRLKEVGATIEDRVQIAPPAATR